MSSMRRRFEHQGRMISYLEGGSAGPSPGTLVLLHAFPLAAEMWAAQLTAAVAGWRFLAPDLRGFGESSLEPPEGGSTLPAFSIDDYATDVIALLDILKVGRAVVAGLSMGGYAALAVARRAGTRVGGLVLADTRLEADSESARAGRDELLGVLGAGGAAAVVDRLMPGLVGATTRQSRPDVVADVRRLAGMQDPEAVRRAIHRLRDRPDSTATLEAFAGPVLIVVGAEDEVTPVDVARQMHGRAPGAAFAVIEHAGHLSNLEQPAEFNAALGRFLASH
jgi:pimeloyl-ACP methyl ester carboxylesterase